MITDSEATNTVVASIIVVETKPHKINPAVRNGRNSTIGALKRPPNISPIQLIMTAVDIVIQNGPKLDLL